MKRKIIPGVIDGDQVLSIFEPTDAIADAAAMMAERNIGAVLIVAGGRLIGIVTERDIVIKAVARKLDVATAKLESIMTPNPMTIRPDEQVYQAMLRMQSGNFRHLPVVDAEGVLHGIVSLRDLYRVVAESLDEDLKNTETMLYGEKYGVAAT